MNEDIDQHDAQTRGSLWQIAAALAHLWLTNCWISRQRLPEPSTFWVYDHNLDSRGWGRDILRGKRMKVTIELEDWKP